jgi:hypothetical protein
MRPPDFMRDEFFPGCSVVAGRYSQELLQEAYLSRIGYELMV